MHTRQGWPREVFSRLEKKVESVFIEYLGGGDPALEGDVHGGQAAALWATAPKCHCDFTFQQVTERQEKDRGAEGRGGRGLARLLASGERTESGRNLRSHPQWPRGIRWPPCFSAHRKPPYHSRRHVSGQGTDLSDQGS